MNRRKHMVYAAMTVLLLISLKAPIAQRFVAGVLVEFAGIIVRLPYWLTEHTRHFSLDRFDPTCPQCM